MDAYVISNLIIADDNETERNVLRLHRRMLRYNNNPFEMTTDAEFKRLFRLTKNIAIRFMELVRQHIDKRIYSNGLSVDSRILVTLIFLATGSYQRPTGQDFFAAMSQSCVSRAINSVCTAIVVNLGPLFVRFPKPAERSTIKQRFYEKFNMPGIIGLIDGTHVVIKRPSIEVEHVYYATRKSSHTKNVQIICDADLRILNVYARFGGSAHDSFIWNNSSIKEMLNNEYGNVIRDSWLLGDSGYGLQPWLMTPFLNPRTDSEKAYNIVHKKRRNMVERCIGVLKSRFRCICPQRILMYSPAVAGTIINACAVLHNVMLSLGYPLPSNDEIEDQINEDEENDNAQTIQYADPGNLQHTVHAIRNTLANKIMTENTIAS